jgi:hypothetical protein
MVLHSCSNCHFELTNNSNFCPNCGAPKLKDRLSTRIVLAELFDLFFLWNKTFFKTCGTLLINPSRVYTFYIDGGRIKYQNPLFFLLLCFLIYHLVISFTNQPMFIIDGMKGSVEGLSSGFSGKKIDASALDKLNRYSKILFFLILPIIAWCSKVVFKSSLLNYAEHLSINSYLLGQVILIGLVISTILLLFHASKILLGTLDFSLIPIYISINQYQIFKNKGFISILKSILFIIFSLIMIFVFNIVLGTIVISIIT